MRVMLVEDEDHKIEDIRRHLDFRYGSKLKLTLCTGVRDAVNLVYETDQDLVILDMALPTFSERGSRGGLQQAVGGIEVIRALSLLHKYPQLIIITQYPDILLDGIGVSLKNVPSIISRQYGLKVVAAILYSYKASEWENLFIAALRSLK